MQVIYLGCYVYYDGKRRVDFIDWYESIQPKVYRNKTDMMVDGGCTNEEDPTYFEYISISKQLFDILANVIENKEIKPMTFSKGKFSKISSLFFTGEENIELIIDESHGYYIVNKLDMVDMVEEFPIYMFDYMIKGLKMAGFQEIKGFVF